jgi:hypothetical protein
MPKLDINLVLRGAVWTSRVVVLCTLIPIITHANAFFESCHPLDCETYFFLSVLVWHVHRWVYAEADRCKHLYKSVASMHRFSDYPDNLYLYMSQLERDSWYRPDDRFVLSVEDPEFSFITRFCFLTGCLNETCTCGDKLACERRLRLLKP